MRPRTRPLAALAALAGLIAVLALAASCSTTPDGDPAGPWRPLFDGHSTAAWRGYRRPDFPAGWQVVDGALTRVAEAGDIITVEQFGDFELELEWMIAPGGNSGILFHVTEDHGAPWETGPEYQVLDNTSHHDGGDPLTCAASDYALYAPAIDETRPPGEWNSARIVVKGPHVEHWLNGEKVVEYELGSNDWKARVAASKFASMPDYGQRKRGHIALQDHGDRVAYRNIRVRTPP